MRTASRLLTCLLAGAGFGVLDSRVNDVSFVADPEAITTTQQVARFASYLLDAGWAWAGLAVLAGWWVGPRLLSAVAGWVAVSAATVAYYGADSLAQGQSFLSDTNEMVLWLVLCVLLCAPLGLVGAVSRRRDGWGLVAGLVVPVGATMQMVLVPPGLGGFVFHPEAVWARWTVLAGAAASAVLLARRLRRHHPRPRPTVAAE